MEQINVVYDAKTFGNRLKKLRKSKGITQSVLAEALYLSEDTISNIENGKTTCMPEHLTKICQLFNVSADYFYFDIKKELYNTVNNDLESIICQLQNCSDFDLMRINQMIHILLATPAA